VEERPVIKATLVASLLVGAGVVLAPTASAEVSAACWAHLAGVKQANTPAADRRYHLERGEASPCTEYDASDNYGPYQQRQQEQRQEDAPREDRKHYDSPGWGCKLTFTGYHCG
jgi:hypothetical protein